MAIVTDIVSIEDLELEPTGYYWDFPETIFTFGKYLSNSCLLKIAFGSCNCYVRIRGTQAKVVSIQSTTESIDLEELYDSLKKYSIKTVKFLEQKINLRSQLPGGYKEAHWYTYESWRENTQISRNRRWQFRKAASSYDFVPVSKDSPSDLEEALRILSVWAKEAGKRQRILGVGHYASCIRSHPKLETSHLFFARPKGSNENVGIIGGYVRDKYAVAVNVKHDWSNKWLIHALWGFWVDYVHSNCGVTVATAGGTNGKMTNNIKHRMGMKREDYYRPPKVLLASEVLSEARLVSNQ